MTEETEACLRLLQRAQFPSSRMLDNIPFTKNSLCDWIFDTIEMNSWLKNPENVLMIGGPPGCGKSVLAKHLIYQLPTALEPKTAKVLYHIFDDRHENLRPESMLASLLYQLCQERPSLTRHAISAFRSMGKEFASSSEVLINIFLSIIPVYDIKHIIVVLDGIDKNLSDILKLTDRLKQPGSVGFVLTTRHNTLESEEDLIFIDWNSNFPMSNIQNFVEQRLENIKLDDVGKDWVKKKLEVESSFLWSELILQHLEKSLASGQTFQSLMPTLFSQFHHLEEIYDKYFQLLKEKSSEEDWILFFEVAKLMVVSQRPLTVEAHADALNVGSGGHEPHPSWPNGCTSFQLQRITSEVESLGLLRQDSSGHLQFLHTSLIDYLVSPEPKMRITQISLVDAHFSMAKKCVAQIHGNLCADITACDITSFHETFTEYAATSWMVHFSNCQYFTRDVLLLDSVYKLFNFPNNLSPPTQWLILYEHATSETLPRHKVFGPLFGGAYFGLLPLVEKALRIGADIEAQDDDGKTALHWASERGHSSVVSVLLSNGANVNSITYSGWSSLHLAAFKGDDGMIALLLTNGADVNLEGGDGRNPLHCAVEAGRVKVIDTLLKAGADVTRRSYTGVSIIHLAQNLSSDESLRVLVMSSTAPEALLRRSIFDNDPITLDLLFQWRLDVIVQWYHWVGELLEEGLPKKEISDLLLQSENLDWLAGGDVQYRPKQTWKFIPEFKHRHCCAHHLTVLKVSVERHILNLDTSTQIHQEDNSSGDQAEVELNMGACVLGDSSVDSTRSGSRPLDPEQHFVELERREQELIKLCGIGGVFIPEHHSKSGRINPGYALMRRHTAQVMYGASGVSALYDYRI